jgi:hypothetical protein
VGWPSLRLLLPMEEAGGIVGESRLAQTELGFRSIKRLSLENTRLAMVTP